MTKTKFVVGGTVYEVPPLTFWTWRREGAWDDLQKLGQLTDVFEQMECMLTLMQKGLKQDGVEVNLEDLLKVVSFNDVRALNESVTTLVKNSGLGGEGSSGESGESRS